MVRTGSHRLYTTTVPQIRQLPIGIVLDQKMKQFKNAVPLMVNLKNEAIRERHWTALMQQTGQTFDMHPERFTLANMFAMELHKYQEIAIDIVTNAVKELAIERGVQEVAQTWSTMAFGVHRHFKGAEERGYTLAAVDEIMQVLEDNFVTMQSMAASKYVQQCSACYRSCTDRLPIASRPADSSAPSCPSCRSGSTRWPPPPR